LLGHRLDFALSADIGRSSGRATELRTQAGLVGEVPAAASPGSLNMSALQHVMDLSGRAVDHLSDGGRPPDNFGIVMFREVFALLVHGVS
jgi:hypothetical protein